MGARRGVARGDRHPKAKLNKQKVRHARRLYKKGATISELARRYGVSSAAMSFALRGVTWKHVKGAIDTVSTAKGERNPHAKLTVNEVRQIRSSRRLSAAELAARYSVSESTITLVRNRKIWKDVT